MPPFTFMPSGVAQGPAAFLVGFPFLGVPQGTHTGRHWREGEGGGAGTPPGGGEGYRSPPTDALNPLEGLTGPLPSPGTPPSAAPRLPGKPCPGPQLSAAQGGTSPSGCPLPGPHRFTAPPWTTGHSGDIEDRSKEGFSQCSPESQQLLSSKAQAPSIDTWWHRAPQGPSCLVGQCPSPRARGEV